MNFCNGYRTKIKPSAKFSEISGRKIEKHIPQKAQINAEKEKVQKTSAKINVISGRKNLAP